MESWYMAAQVMFNISQVTLAVDAMFMLFLLHHYSPDPPKLLHILITQFASIPCK